MNVEEIVQGSGLENIYASSLGYSERFYSSAEQQCCKPSRKWTQDKDKTWWCGEYCIFISLFVGTEDDLSPYTVFGVEGLAFWPDIQSIFFFL